MKMDNRAYLTNFMFGILGLFIIVLILTILAPVKYGSMDLERSIEVVTETQKTLHERFEITDISEPENATQIIVNVIYEFIDFIVYSSFEIAKLGVIVANEHLNENGIKLIIILIIISLLIPLLSILFFLIKLSLVLMVLILEWTYRKKDRKKVEELKDGK